MRLPNLAEPAKRGRRANSTHRSASPVGVLPSHEDASDDGGDEAAEQDTMENQGEDQDESSSSDGAEE